MEDVSKLKDLLAYDWWRFDPEAPAQWYQAPYHWINMVEGIFWCLFGGLVLFRHFWHFRREQPYASRRRLLEICYALCFFCFALTDFREAYALQNWLILTKGLNLGCLIWLRHLVRNRYYPSSKTY